MANQTLTRTAARPTGAAWGRFLLVWQTNLLLLLRNRVAMFWVIAFPIGLMLLFGALYRSQPAYIPYLATGMIVLSLLANGVVGNAATLAVWRERGILRRVQATPLPLWQLLGGRILAQSVLMIGQTGLLLATSAVVFGAHYELGNVLRAIPAIVAGALLFIGIGQALAALVTKAETVNIVAQVIYFPLMFLGGLMIPFSQMPDYLQSVGKFLPSAMIMDLVRTPLLGLPVAQMNLPLPATLGGVTLYFAVTIAVAARFFKWS